MPEILIICLALTGAIIPVLSLIGPYTQGKTQLNPLSVFRIPLVLSVVYVAMFLLGYLLASLIKGFFVNSASLMAFPVFVILGIKILWENMQPSNNDRDYDLDNSRIAFFAAFASGINVLLAGIALFFASPSVFLCIAYIFVFCFFLCFVMIITLRRMKKMPSFKYLFVISALTLIFSGLYFLLEYKSWI